MSIPKVPKSLMCKFEPQEDWITYDGELHGVDHMTRVFLLQELLCSLLEEKGWKIHRNALRYASMAHDVGRVDDSEDPQHGAKSASWMRKYLVGKMLPEDLDIATYITHWHSLPDGDAPVMTNELMILKDADGLDRVRLGDLDRDYLRTDEAKALVKTAVLLENESITYSGILPTFESVLSSGIGLGLIDETK